MGIKHMLQYLLHSTYTYLCYKTPLGYKRPLFQPPTPGSRVFIEKLYSKPFMTHNTSLSRISPLLSWTDIVEQPQESFYCYIFKSGKIMVHCQIIFSHTLHQNSRSHILFFLWSVF